MKIDWQVIPPKFRYLDNVVFRNRPLNDFLVVPWIDELGRAATLAERTSMRMDCGLSKSELADLARVHRELQKREDNLAILHWYVATRDEEEEKTAGWVLRLLSLLRDLGEFGVSPFDQPLVVCELKPTWQNLPSELGYLREAIERYCADLPQGSEDGPVAQGMHFLRKTVQMLSGERRRLRELGKRIEHDRSEIKAWHQLVRKSPEAGKFLELENVLLSAEFLDEPIA